MLYLLFYYTCLYVTIAMNAPVSTSLQAIDISTFTTVVTSTVFISVTEIVFVSTSSSPGQTPMTESEGSFSHSMGLIWLTLFIVFFVFTVVAVMTSVVLIYLRKRNSSLRSSNPSVGKCASKTINIVTAYTYMLLSLHVYSYRLSCQLVIWYTT